MKLIYVAGPLNTGSDEIQNIRNAILVANDILNIGALPYVPHLSTLWHLVIPRHREIWLATDKRWIDKCDALYRMPGDSVGADEEVEYAIRNDILVFDLFMALTEFIKRPEPAPESEYEASYLDGLETLPTDDGYGSF